MLVYATSEIHAMWTEIKMRQFIWSEWLGWMTGLPDEQIRDAVDVC